MSPQELQIRSADLSHDPVASPTAELKILVADDHIANRKVVEIMLRARAQVVLAEDGLQAVEAARAETFDLILMDMQMPVMDGLTATRQIRADEVASGLRRTPILMLSAHDAEDYGGLGQEAGADGFLAKPISMIDLLLAVDQAIKDHTPKV